MNYQEIKRKLERNTCSVHHKYPKVSVIENRINLECCCEPFKSKLTELTKQYVGEQVKTDLENKLRNIFN